MARRVDTEQFLNGVLFCSFSIIVLALFLLLLDVVGAVNAVLYWLPLSLTGYAQILNALVSVLLTAALVVLYKEQAQIQQRQEV